MTHAEKIARWLPKSREGVTDFGVEIGAFKTPIPGLRPLYFDRFPSFGYEKVLADYFGDACRLSVESHTLDYVATSHVIEHLANPVRALWEWARVTRHGGILYMVVPDRRFTFDHTRPLTAPEHVIQDFERRTTDCDATHIADYLDGLDWTRWNPNGTAADHAQTREHLRTAYTAAVAAKEDINIHFHTFEQQSFLTLIALMNAHPASPVQLEVLDAVERFPAECPNGFLVVLRVRKPVEDILEGWARRAFAGGDVRRVLRADTRRF